MTINESHKIIVILKQCCLLVYFINFHKKYLYLLKIILKISENIEEKVHHRGFGFTFIAFRWLGMKFLRLLT